MEERRRWLGNQFVDESLTRGLKVRKNLLEKNPNLIILAELRYRDAHRSYLPEDHPWWKRESGKKVIGWEEGGYFLLDFSNPDYVAQVARQAKAIMNSGVFDGLMLDWWEDDEQRIALIREIRKTIGGDPLVLVNANDRKTPKTAALINGHFMECYRTKTPEDWKRIADALQWAEANLKAPRINCLETWYHSSRDDLNLMRATTTLSMTLSNGYCLFSDPNPLPTADHLHDWYPFWDHNLGGPKSPGTGTTTGAADVSSGEDSAVYNPPGNHPVSVEFRTPRSAASSGRVGTSFTVAPGDGDLFLAIPAG